VVEERREEVERGKEEGRAGEAEAGGGRDRGRERER
jgi:hypothetical protein